MGCAGSRFTSFYRETASTIGVAALVMLFGAALLLGDPNYYWRDDYQLNYLPKFQEIARSLRQGEFPLLTPLTWQAGDMGGEYQFGVFSIWSLVCISSVFSLGLSMPLTAALLSLLHLGILAAGAFRLARGQSLRSAESALVAVTASLNGWVFVWGAMNWFVALAGLAWLPWVWWSFERALASPRPARSAVLSGMFIYLTVTAGWHFTTFMIGILTAWLSLRSLTAGRKVYELWPLPAAWMLGLGLSAPAWLMHLEYSPFTNRGHTPMGELSWDWTVPLTSLPGLIIPAHVCSWSVFSYGWRPHRCVELAGAFAPLAVVVSAIARLGVSWLRKNGWELALACFALTLAMLPGLGNVRWSFRWLPLFFLVLGLMAGRGLSELRRFWERGLPPVIGMWAAGLSGAALFLLQTRQDDPTPFALRYCLIGLAVCLLWAYLEIRAPQTRPWLPTLVGLSSLGCIYAVPSSFIEVCRWEILAHSGTDQQLRQGTRYLSICSYNDLYKGQLDGTIVDLCPGNCCLYDGFEFINGYSPLHLTSLTTLFGFQTHGVLSHEACERILRCETGRNALLDLLGVDGLVVSDDFASFLPHLQANGWETTAKREGGTVLHRRGLPSPRIRVLEQVQWNIGVEEIYNQLLKRIDSPVPLILSESPPWPGVDGPLGRADFKVVQETRHSIQIQVRTESGKPGSLLAISRPWYPGYAARFNGEPVPLYRLNQVIPALLLPAGAEGLLVVEYRPRSLLIGLMLCLASLLLCGGMLLGSWFLPSGSLRRARSEAEQHAMQR